MKLKPVKRNTTPAPAPKKQETPKQKLPPDDYKPIYPPVRFLVREVPSRKDPESLVRQYLEVSVKRSDNDLGLPYLWISMYQESEFYTGYLKGKTTYLPLRHVNDLMEHISDVYEQCEKDGLLEEELD